MRRVVGLMAMVALGAAAAPNPLAAQPQDLDPGDVTATRASLQELQSYYANGASSQAYSRELRGAALARAEAIQRRLREGDFRSGDRVVLAVEGEPVLNDTFVVTPALMLELPTIGAISLRGVLRSELSDYMEREIGRYINDPQVRARSYIRVQVSGEIGSPGYYILPAELPITEAIMQIGGPSAAADVTKLAVLRGSEKVITAEEAQLAIRQSRTLGELGIQDGDEINLPRKSPFSPGQIGSTLLVLSGAIVALATLLGRVGP